MGYFPLYFLKFLCKYKNAWPLLKYAHINLKYLLVAFEVYVQPWANACLSTPTLGASCTDLLEYYFKQTRSVAEFFLSQYGTPSLLGKIM